MNEEALKDIIKQYYIKYYALMDYLTDNKICVDDYEIAEYENKMVEDLKDKWKDMLDDPETNL